MVRKLGWLNFGVEYFPFRLATVFLQLSHVSHVICSFLSQYNLSLFFYRHIILFPSLQTALKRVSFPTVIKILSLESFCQIKVAFHTVHK